MAYFMHQGRRVAFSTLSRQTESLVACPEDRTPLWVFFYFGGNARGRNDSALLAGQRANTYTTRLK